MARMIPWLGRARAQTQAIEAKSYPGTTAYMIPAGQAVWMRRDVSKFADEGYRRNVIAHRAVAMIATAAASVPWKLSERRSRTVRTLEAHPLLTLLNTPNPLQGGTELCEALYAHRLIAGNSYLHAIGPKDGAPLELHVLRPDRVAIIPGQGGIPKAYRYTIDGRALDVAVDAISGQSRILHLKAFHPLDDWYGLSPMEAAAYSIDQHNQCSAWNQALLQNGARPSGALMVKAGEGNAGMLSETQYGRLKSQLDEQFSGAMNAGRPLLLEGGLEWKEMSLNPRDMDFINIKHSSARDVALAFGVPPQLLGIPGDNTYANLKEARLALWEQTIVPLLQTVTDALNNWLVPMFDTALVLSLDQDAIPIFAEKRDAYWERISRADFLSAEEKRNLLGIAHGK
ncbi:MAG: phage portal protein [Alphaproteobacteria bacterium]|nr:phage portal protein [Alphaproteobacteria bacterium]